MNPSDMGRPDVGPLYDAEVNFGNTDLALACMANDIEEATRLLDEGADIEEGSNANNTAPLGLAADRGCEKLVRLLCERGADVNRQTGELDTTALFKACRHGFHKIVQVLIDHGADVSIGNRRGFTPLYSAAEYGHYPVVLALLNAGAPIHCVIDNVSGNAMYECSRNGHWQIIKILCAHGADPNASHTKYSALYVAAEFGHIGCLTELLRAGAHPDIGNVVRGFTPLGIAAEKRFEECTEALVESGASPYELHCGKPPAFNPKTAEARAEEAAAQEEALSASVMESAGTWMNRFVELCSQMQPGLDAAGLREHLDSCGVTKTEKSVVSLWRSLITCDEDVETLPPPIVVRAKLRCRPGKETAAAVAALTAAFTRSNGTTCCEVHSHADGSAELLAYFGHTTQTTVRPAPLENPLQRCVDLLHQFSTLEGMTRTDTAESYIRDFETAADVAQVLYTVFSTDRYTSDPSTWVWTQVCSFLSDLLFSPEEVAAAAETGSSPLLTTYLAVTEAFSTVEHLTVVHNNTCLAVAASSIPVLDLVPSHDAMQQAQRELWTRVCDVRLGSKDSVLTGSLFPVPGIRSHRFWALDIGGVHTYIDDLYVRQDGNRGVATPAGTLEDLPEDVVPEFDPSLGATLAEGSSVIAQDSLQLWRRATVVSATDDGVVLRFAGLSPSWDETMPRTSSTIRPSTGDQVQHTLQCALGSVTFFVEGKEVQPKAVVAGPGASVNSTEGLLGGDTPWIDDNWAASRRSVLTFEFSTPVALEAYSLVSLSGVASPCVWSILGSDTPGGL